jgi:hypothetical protein
MKTIEIGFPFLQCLQFNDKKIYFSSPNVSAIFDTALIPLPPYCEDRVANITNFKKSEQGTIDSKCNKYENN